MSHKTAIVRRAALAVALLFGLSGSALAARVANKVDGRDARAAVAKNRAKKASKAKLLQVSPVRSSKSGKSLQVIAVAERGRGKTYKAYNVNKKTGVARATKTGLVSEKSATAAATKVLRRNNGTFSGVVFDGVSRGGNLRFTSQTDKTDRAFVSPVTGKAFKREK